MNDNFNTAVSIDRDPDKGIILRASRNILLGEKFGFFSGQVSLTDSMHTIHLDNQVIEGDGKLRFLSHSCAPNAEFTLKDRWLYARQDITAGEEVTIDYTYTEPYFVSPFKCECGAANCKGMIGTMPS